MKRDLNATINREFAQVGGKKRQIKDDGKQRLSRKS